MQKAHSNIDWENKPSDKTPINEQNLNKMDRSIDAIDDRVITLDTTKFDKTDAQGLFKDVSLNSENGVITFTLYNGATKTIDTLLEKIAVNFDYNPTMQQLIITLDDGEIKYIDMSALVTQYEFLDSDTIAFTANASGKISAIVKEGSIEEKHLRPDYLADVKTEVSKAQASAQSAAQSADDADYDAKLAQSYAVGGTGTRDGEDADNAKYYSEKSQEALQKLQEAAVTGVKGNAESAYRTGDVNITPDNIGLGNVNNTSDENKPVSNAQRTAIDAKVSKSGDTINGNLEMTNHSINNVLSVNGSVGENDFWRIAGGDTGSNAGYVEIATADDGTEPIYVRQYNNGAFGSISRQLTLLDEWGNTLIPGTLIPNNANSGAIGDQHRQFSRAYIDGIGGTMAENDYWGISGKNSGIDCGYLDIATGDNGNEPIYVTQYSDGNFTHALDSSSIAHRATLLDENGNTSFPGQVTAPVFQGQATAIRDSGDGRTLTFNYSADGLSDPEWLAAWNGNELRGVAASKYKGSGIYSQTSYTPNVGTGDNVTIQYHKIQFNNGLMILYMRGIITGTKRTFRFPTAFIDTQYLVYWMNAPFFHYELHPLRDNYNGNQITQSGMTAVVTWNCNRKEGELTLDRYSTAAFEYSHARGYGEYWSGTPGIVCIGRWK